MFRRFVIDWLIWYTERELYNTPVKKALNDEQMQKYLAALYEMPGFKQYCVERETRFIHSLARENKETIKGQRVENAILFQKAMSAAQREALAKVPTKALPRAQSSSVSPTRNRAVTN